MKQLIKKNVTTAKAAEVVASIRDPVGERPREGAEDEERNGRDCEEEAGNMGLESHHAFEEEWEEVLDAGKGEHHDRGGKARGEEVDIPEQAKVAERVFATGLAQDKEGPEYGRYTEAREDGWRGPAKREALVDRPQECGQGKEEDDGTRVIERPGRGRRPAFGDTLEA